jgi:hypothetical protein
MSRKVRALPAVVVLSFAFSAAACANAVGPRETQAPADTSGPNVGRNADTSGPNVARNADTSGPNVSRNGAN